MLRAVQAATRQVTREIRDTDAEHLLRQDVINALLKTWDRLRQPLGEAADDLAQEYARLGERVEESQRLVRSDVGAVIVRCPRHGQRVQHPIRELRRSEDLVVGEVGNACQHIRIPTSQCETSLSAHLASLVAHRSLAVASSATVNGG